MERLKVCETAKVIIYNSYMIQPCKEILSLASKWMLDEIAVCTCQDDKGKTHMNGID